MRYLDLYRQLNVELGEEPDIHGISCPLGRDVLWELAEVLRMDGDTAAADTLNKMVVLADRAFALMSVNEDFHSMVVARFHNMDVATFVKTVLQPGSTHAHAPEAALQTAVDFLLIFGEHMTTTLAHYEGAREWGEAAVHFAKLLIALFWRTEDDPDYFHRLSDLVDPDFLRVLKGMLEKQIKPLADRSPTVRSVLPGLPGGGPLLR